MQAALAAPDWPTVLPAMSNVGLMHYWRGEYGTAHQVLARERAMRKQRYGRSGSGIKIYIHLGAVLYALGHVDEAQAMLEAALAQMQTWPDSEYRRTECLLAENHLAQMFMALGRAEAAAAVLAHVATGVAQQRPGLQLHAAVLLAQAAAAADDGASAHAWLQAAAALQQRCAPFDMSAA